MHCHVWTRNPVTLTRSPGYPRSSAVSGPAPHFVMLSALMDSRRVWALRKGGENSCNGAPS
jgi:hypothetical protein